MSLKYIKHFLFNIKIYDNEVEFKFNIYEYKTPTTNIRIWDKNLNEWTIPLSGPQLIEPDTRRNPAVYGYKNGYIISIFNLNDNKFISIKDFMYIFSLNDSFIECLYSVLTSNDLFTYFEMQTPCFDFIKKKYPAINNELIYSIIKQKKILLNVNTFNLLFKRYLYFDEDTINELIAM